MKLTINVEKAGLNKHAHVEYVERVIIRSRVYFYEMAELLA